MSKFSEERARRPHLAEIAEWYDVGHRHGVSAAHRDWQAALVSVVPLEVSKDGPAMTAAWLRIHFELA